MENGTRERLDTVVVGGGLGGLAAATYIARAGRPVTLLERSSGLGGRAATTEASDFRFNLGPHALYRTGPAADVLRELGVAYTGKVPPVSGHVVRGGTLYPIAQSPKWFLTTRLLSVGARVDLLRLFAKLPRIKARSLRGVSVDDWLAGQSKHDSVQALVRGLVRVATYANDPELSAEIAVMQLQGGQKGVLYLDGGWQTLVDRLQNAAERAGARIETSAPVERIEHDGTVRGVLLKDGRRIEARNVVLATTPEAVAAIVGEGPLRERARACVPVRAACLDIGLRRLPRPDQRFGFGTDQPYYLSVHSTVAKDIAPERGATLHVAKYLAADDHDAKGHERELESLTDLLQPGWRDELIARRFLPNMNVVGAAARAVDGGLAGRPGVETEIDGLYLSGDWVGAAGWLTDATMASARRAAELVLQRAPVSTERPVGVA
jgi:phytoene dehydrogenase-like protein